MKSLLDIILISGLTLIMVLCFILIRKNKKELSSLILIAIFIQMAFVIIQFYAQVHEIEFLQLIGFITGEQVYLVLSPLIYFYIKSLFYNQRTFNKKLYYFLFPLVGFHLLVTVPLVLNLFFQIFNFYIREISDWELAFIDQPFYLMILLILSWRLLNKLEPKLKERYSDLETKSLTWIKYFLLVLILCCCIDVCTYLYDVVYGGAELNTSLITLIFLIVSMFILGYHGMFQSTFFIPSYILEDELESDTKMDLSTNESKSALDSLSESEILELEKNLMHLLKKEKVYLEESLSLNQLAMYLNISDKKLSTLINKKLGISFYDLINNHRLDEFKEKVIDPKYEKYTILALALESGFRSKTSFNRIFKSKMKISPSQYKRNHSKLKCSKSKF